MKKIFIFLLTIFLSFAVVRSSFAQTSSPTDLLGDLLKILFSFQNIPDAPPVSPPDTTPGISTTPPPFIPPPAGDIARYLPKPLNPISNKVNAYIRSTASKCLSKKPLYEQAAAYTGVRWEIIAAIHYREDIFHCGEGSLVSGRAIGTCEPDLAGECSSGRTGLGIPISLPGGCCGMASLLDSAVYAGRHLVGKIGRIPANYQDLVISLGRYNGNGNQNCYRTLYKSCPPYFENEDHIYPNNWLDYRHDLMYWVYCADHTLCEVPRIHEIPGALTVIRILTGI